MEYVGAKQYHSHVKRIYQRKDWLSLVGGRHWKITNRLFGIFAAMPYYKRKTWPVLNSKTRAYLLSWLLQILYQVEVIPKAGYVHRDLTPGNFIITPSGKIKLIDLELAYSTNDQYPLPAFSVGTPGYMSFE